MILVAEAIGYKALNALSGSRKKAEVHSIFDRAFYIKINRNSLVNVIKDKNYISPMSIVLKNSYHESFKSLSIREGMNLEVGENILLFENKMLTIKLGRSSTWFSPTFPKNVFIKPGDISLNLRVLRDIIYTCPNKEGLVPLLENVELYGPMRLFLNKQETTISESARPGIETLMWGLFRGDFHTVTSNALSILGLGSGLTPSCDDFLAGLILSLKIGGGALLKKRKAELIFHRKISSKICRLAKAKTTVYSQILLNQARFGEGPEAIVELVHSILTKDPNHVASVTKSVMKIGETSGADIAIGVYYGIRFLLSRLEHLSMRSIEDLYEIS
jgi:hypothetical protein